MLFPMCPINSTGKTLVNKQESAKLKILDILSLLVFCNMVDGDTIFIELNSNHLSLCKRMKTSLFKGKFLTKSFKNVKTMHLN